MILWFYPLSFTLRVSLVLIHLNMKPREKNAEIPWAAKRASLLEGLAQQNRLDCRIRFLSWHALIQMEPPGLRIFEVTKGKYESINRNPK